MDLRRKRLLFNTASAVFNQLVIIVCGFVLPRLIIVHYGSEVNGLISSISQFLAFFSVMDLGVGAVVRASLYEPLAKGDNDGVSRVLISSRRFFRKIGAILCLYTIGLMAAYPFLVDNSFDHLYVAVLIFALAASAIAQYFIGVVYQQLLVADQRSYVQQLLSAAAYVANTVLCVVLIRLGMSIQLVKLLAASVLVLQPLVQMLYVRRHYRLNFKLQLTEEPIKQKWNGLAQHVAQYVLRRTDIIVLTLFSTLENVSIYYVYSLVTSGLQQLVGILTTGMPSLFGDMLARDEKQKLDEVFPAFEWMVHTSVTWLHAVAGATVLAFVRVYTAGVQDANYIVPAFAALMILTSGLFCLRTPYSIMVLAAGHFRQTQFAAMVEPILNIAVSVALVWKLGLIGVVIGTLAAALYRTCYLAWYLKKAILMRGVRHYLGHLAVDIATAAAILLAARWMQMGEVSYLSWFLFAAKVGAAALGVSALFSLVFYRGTMVSAFRLLLSRWGKASA